MAERGRTVRVTGLPTEIQEERLEDKLCIHFQRGSNGGGEVVSVSTVRPGPDLVLVTFEDSRVAQRVIQQNRHILEVDGKSFNLTAKEHPAGHAQDKVVINLSATVDYSQLSAGKKTLKALNKNHPDVQMNYNLTRGLCSLSGSYSTVQAALAQLLGQNEHPQTPHNNLQTSTDDQPSHSSPLPPAQVLQDRNGTHVDKKEKPLVEKHQSASSQRQLTPGGYEWEGQGATASSPALEEDFSLMVDAEMFQYLQKYCKEEYHQILRCQGVAVVDYTHQGLTTLLLQVASGDGEREQERLRKAKEGISRLYEANQANVCRDKLSKVLFPGAGLKRAIDELNSKFAKLLFSEDEDNIYLVGSRDDVSEGKTFLLLYDHNEEHKTEVTPPRRFQDSWPTNETKPPVAGPAVPESNGLDQEEDEGRFDGSSKSRKLAAQFQKDLRLAPIGSKTSDFAVKGHPQSKGKTRHGPMLGYDVLSDTNAQSTSSDILFKSRDAATDTRPKTTVSPIQSHSLATPSPPNASGSSLRRSSSFSGATPRREQEISPKSDTETGAGRGRSSSFGSGSKQEQHIAQVTVNTIMWRHIAKAFKPRIMELTSEIQVTERHLEGNKDIGVLLTGTDPSKVAACHKGLQMLIDSVSVDFGIKSLPLSDLGVTDSSNEALDSCCVEIRSLYKKISMEIYDNVLYFFGPEAMCSQVCDSLFEVFSGAQQNSSRPSTSGGSEGSANAKINGQASANKHAVIREKVKLTSGAGNNVENAHESIRNGSSGGRSVTSRGDRTRAKRQQTTATGGSVCEGCSGAGTTVKKTHCGATLCSDCLPILHSQCRACESREEPKTRGIKGEMTSANLPMSIPGYNRDPVIKITYNIPDGIQGENHPYPGRPFRGGVFEAFLPDCLTTRELLPRLEKAFRMGHTFTVTRAGQVFWDNIPHKTSLNGGKSASGYPDFSYLGRLSDILDSYGI